MVSYNLTDQCSIGQLDYKGRHKSHRTVKGLKIGDQEQGNRDCEIERDWWEKKDKGRNVGQDKHAVLLKHLYIASVKAYWMLSSQSLLSLNFLWIWIEKL